MKKKRVRLNNYFPNNGNDDEFWYTWEHDVYVPHCRPDKMYETEKIFCAEFTNMKVKIDKNKDWIEVITGNNRVHIDLGDFHNASFNWGDPLPARLDVVSVYDLDGDITSKCVDPWYPWVRNSIERFCLLARDVVTC